MNFTRSLLNHFSMRKVDRSSSVVNRLVSAARGVVRIFHSLIGIVFLLGIGQGCPAGGHPLADGQ
jgi:hypothetical protein